MKVIFQKHIATYYTHPMITRRVLEGLYAFEMHDHVELMELYPYIGVAVQLLVVSLFTIITCKYFGFFAFMIVGSIMTWLTMSEVEGGNVYSPYGFVFFWILVMLLAVLCRAMSKPIVMGAMQYLQQPIKYNPTLNGMDSLTGLCLVIVTLVCFGNYFLGHGFSKEFIVVQVLVVTVALFNLSLRVGNNSTSMIIGLVVVSLITMLCIPGLIDLLEAVTISIKKGLEIDADARGMPKMNSVTDFTYKVHKLNFAEWNSFMFTTGYYLAYFVGMSFSAILDVDNTFGTSNCIPFAGDNENQKGNCGS